VAAAARCSAARVRVSWHWRRRCIPLGFGLAGFGFRQGKDLREGRRDLSALKGESLASSPTEVVDWVCWGQGRDWRKEEVELGRKGVHRTLTDAEKKLAAEVQAARDKAEGGGAAEQAALKEKEAELSALCLQV
jgi:hypothetical protein